MFGPLVSLLGTCRGGRGEWPQVQSIPGVILEHNVCLCVRQRESPISLYPTTNYVCRAAPNGILHIARWVREIRNIVWRSTMLPPPSEQTETDWRAWKSDNADGAALHTHKGWFISLRRICVAVCVYKFEKVLWIPGPNVQEVETWSLKVVVWWYSASQILWHCLGMATDCHNIQWFHSSRSHFWTD